VFTLMDFNPFNDLDLVTIAKHANPQKKALLEKQSL